MKRLVFFFSATGNSLYVARELAGENGKVLSIPQLMKKKQFDFEADEIGFVFPLYMHIAPYLVQQLIAQAHLKADYFFTVITFGARDLSAVELWETVAEKAGYHFDYLNTIKMVDNWLHHFDMNEQKAIDKHIPEQLEPIKEAINERRKWWRPVSDEERATHAYAYHASGLDQYQGFRFHSEFHFVVTDACIRCGICTKVCPRGNWHLGDDRAMTSGACDYCLACIQNCPKKAIQFAPVPSMPFLKPEENPQARYRNPNVTVKDLINANHQYDD